MNDVKIFAISINPQPWAIGELGVGRRGGKVYPYVGPNQQLKSYQEAVREEIADNHWYDDQPYEGAVKLECYFWRNTTGGNYADVTNLIKGTEDAIQGLVIKNDRQTLAVDGRIVEQGPDVVGKVIIVVERCRELKIPSTLLDIAKKIDEHEKRVNKIIQPALWNENPEEDF